VSSDGAILCRNDAAEEMLTALEIDPALSTCCAVLGCDGHKDGCATVRASACAPHADIRHDLGTPSGRHALWVSAFPLGGEPAKVLLQLRLGDPHDRRQRSDPQWRSVTRLRICALGQTTICADGATVDGDWLDTRAGALLRYLVARRERAVSSDEIGEGLWRDAGYTIARNVRTTIHRLRSELEPFRPSHDPPDYVLTRGGSYMLNPDRVEIDADEFELKLRRADGLLGADPAGAVALLEDALTLYKGEFLADAPFAEWALAERTRLHDLACTALRTLAEAKLAEQEVEAARVTLCRLAALQPLDEATARELIALEIRIGRGSDAKRRYDRLDRMMRETLGVQPMFTLGDLAAR